MAQRKVLQLSRSLRSLKKIEGTNKRYKFKGITSVQDLRSFFYEYSLFVGDLQSLPLMPQLKTIGSLRHLLLKGGRIMGDVNAALGTITKLSTGVYDVEGAGERLFRRAGGRLTGKLLLSVPGNNIFSRTARTVIGANTQKAFDQQMKKMFRSNTPDKPVVNVVGGFDAQQVANSIEDALAIVTEDVSRQAYPFVPVRTGRLRGTLNATLEREKARGGTMPVGKVSIGDSTTMDYGAIIEFGSGKSFNQGASHLNRYFPIPERIKSLKASSRNRRAVNSKTGKGAMLRRGARNTMAKMNQSAGNINVGVNPNPDVEAKKLRS